MEIKRIEYLWQVRKKTNSMPFWYVVSKDDPKMMEPDPVLTSILEEGINALNTSSSLREVADFISAKAGVKLSHMGLAKIWTKCGRERELQAKTRRPKKTLAEIKESRRRKRIAYEKNRIKYALERVEKLGGEIESIKEEVKAKEPMKGIVEVEFLPTPEQAPNIIFKPNPGPQTEFLASEEQEVLYGGAAGGGKSYAMLADPLRYFSNPNFRGLLLRRTNDELKELKWKARDLYDNDVVKGKFRQQDSLWVFPSGAEFWLTYLERDEDVKRYQGQSFTWIGIDELTQYASPFAWDYLRSRLRSTDPSIPLCMRATTNPGGPGHSWVKRMFIDPAPPKQAFSATDIDTGATLVHPDFYKHPHPQAGQPHPKAGLPLFQRKFIPASLYDNPYIIQDDKYEASLMSLPEQQRRQLLEGDWSIVEGAAFAEFRPSVHVVKPFKIPEGWRKFRSCDFGYSTFSAVHWYAIDPDNRLYVYRELYVSKATGVDLAKMVLKAEAGEKITYGVLDSSVWAMRGQNGPSIAEEMIAHGCNWRPSDRSQGSRVNGKNRLHELLKVDPVYNKPGIMFFDTCRQIISDLPMIPMDPKGGEDIDDRYASDHTYDSIRYGIMTRPRGHELPSIASYKSTYTPSHPIFGY
jgi:terminase large subunit-like protein